MRDQVTIKYEANPITRLDHFKIKISDSVSEIEHSIRLDFKGVIKTISLKFFLLENLNNEPKYLK